MEKKIVEIGEIAVNQHFLPFPKKKCPKAFLMGSENRGCLEKGLTWKKNHRHCSELE